MIKNRLVLISLLFACILLLSSCGKSSDDGQSVDQAKPSYIPLVWGKMDVQFKSSDMAYSIRMKRIDDKIYAISDGLWMLEPATGKETLLIKDGVGPDEISCPNRMHFFEDKLYISSLQPSSHLGYFVPQAPQYKLDRKAFANAYTLGDFAFISPDLILTTYAYNKEYFVKVYDFKEQRFVKRLGKRTFIPLMNKFNINWSSLCRVEDKVYIVETINPQVRVLNLSDYRFLPAIQLMPPFFKPVPKEFVKNAKFNHQAFVKWMSGWSAIIDIMGRGDWLLVKYRWGAELSFAYELINRGDTSKRYYIDRSPKNVYDFVVNERGVHFDLCEEVDDGLIWQKADIAF